MVIKLDLTKIDSVIKKIIITFLLIVANITYSFDNLISDIHFNGLERISLDTVLSNVSLKIGDFINNDVVADNIRVLFSTKYFEDVKISIDDTGIALIQVKEYPVINNISFCGNKTIKEEMIKKLLDLKQIQLGQLLNDYSIFEVEQDLKNMYYSIGKFNATVEIITTYLSRNRVDIKILTNEGKTANIKKINITGNRMFNKKKLLSQFALHDQAQRWNFFSSKKYETQKLLHDVDILRNFYLNNGYAKFNVDSTQINLTSDKKNVYLNFHITEGAQYSFSSVNFYGNICSIIPDIKNFINIYPGELYSNKKIKEMEYDIQSMLGKLGYIQSSISIESNIDEINKTIKLYVYINVGSCYYVNEIFFEGNYITKDSVMRREINQMEKTQLNCINILKDQERLKRLNYFKHVDTHIKYLPDKFNEVDVIYRVEERNTGNLNLSVGIGTESGVNIQFGMHQDNILGTGNSISMESAKNRYQTYIEASILQSSCFDIDRMSLESRIFYNNTNTNYTDLSDYNIKNYGINFDCLYSLFEYHRFRIGFHYISNYLNKITPQIAIWRYLKSMNIYPKLLINTCTNNNINFCATDFMLASGWTFNNLNHFYFPTSGSRFNVSSKLTLPGSDNQYYKIEVDGNYYISLDKNSDWVFMTTIYAGYAGGICSQESPFYDNFYAGGINTIRGFRLNSVGPKAAYYCCNKYDKSYSTCCVKNSQDTIGGNVISLFKTELIVPISYLGELYYDTVRMSIFVDCGTVWDTFWKNTEITRAAGIMDYSVPNNVRISSGISLKWVSPVGPIIFSYSKLIKKYLGDIEEPFQFSIGKTW